MKTLHALAIESVAVVDVLPDPIADLKGVLVRLSTDNKAYWCTGTAWLEAAHKSGSAIIDFGTAAGGNTLASVDVVGQTDIQATSSVRAWMMVDSTADHNDTEHLLAPISLRAGNIVPGVGFTIYAVSEWMLTRTFKVRWEWT